MPLQKNEKNVLGLKPKYIHDEERRIEIFEAMERYSNNRQHIPVEWIVELKELCLERV